MHPGELEHRVLKISARTAITGHMQSAIIAEAALSDLPAPGHPEAPTWHTAKDVGGAEHHRELQELHLTEGGVSLETGLFQL